MNALLAPLTEWAEYGAARDILKNKGRIHVTGAVDSEKVHLIQGLTYDVPVRVIATYSDLRAKEIADDLKALSRNVFIFPAKDLIFYQADIHGNKLTLDRIRALRRLLSGQPVTLVTTFDALMTPMPPKSVFENNILDIGKDSIIEEKAIAAKLTAMGYERNYQVEKPGEFSIRGGIIDVFDMTEENPYRIELWGEDIESIRSFDIESQRSLENLSAIRVFPASEMVLSKADINKGLERIKKEAAGQIESLRSAFRTEEAHRLDVTVRTLIEDLTELGIKTNLEGYIKFFYDETCNLCDYMRNDDSVLIIDEPLRVREHVNAVSLEFADSMSSRLEKGYILPAQAELLSGMEEVLAKTGRLPMLEVATLEEKKTLVKCDLKVNITAKTMPGYKGHIDLMIKDLKNYKKLKYRVMILSMSRTRAKRMAEELRDYEISAVYSDDPLREVLPGECVLKYGALSKGFEYPLLKFAVISESDYLGERNKKKPRVKKYSGQKIKDFGELKVGDYVVHENHGLGIYRGIEKVEANKVTKDYMKIEYGDGGILYVLATGFDVIQKYASQDAAKKPKLNKLGTKEWTNTKTKVKEAVDVVAKDLVELYARRQSKEGFVFSKDTVWQKEFEELFPYEETEDQLSAIADTKADMESGRIMDRLICGDVGYGKTEIALRAAFKAVTDGKQVAVLVPTTILARQHYDTFTHRMKDFPIKVGMLSRFRTAAENRQTIQDMKKGMVDIVIGTHRLLSKDVEFKDLGLLVVDEEQRFGVTHKEKIKQLKEDVDVLTLSATPIPRTLHMSLAGIRDMSLLEEPPGERLPIQTFVCEYNEEMVREAIVREISRNGQVYYVYNRVNNIADIAANIAKLVPEANVAYAHGQMNENELESLMMDFMNGEIDVLVSTTIIETGLDISNVNTIIIHDSDKFGLSQLYQLRGRVGRSGRVAYAFLMYRRDYMLKEVAEKRLNAIKEFTDLGSGFKIAMRDLEIRGAGNLLGRKQSGHMEAVGYDLYCKMLNEAVMKLKGNKPDVSDFTTQIDINVDAYIPTDYIVNEVQKLDIYKRIASIESRDEAMDMTDELKDRFGQIPKCVENLLKISLLRVEAHKLYITDIKGDNGIIRINMKKDAHIDALHIPDLMISQGKDLNFVTKGTPYFLLRYPVSGIVGKDEDTLINKLINLIEDMTKWLYIPE